jgi:trimethylamine--corrinoid protein Co-methyltransferase
MRTKPKRSERQKQRQRRQSQSPLLNLPFRQPRNPFPPAEILTPDQIQQLHDASMHILENIGLDFLDDEALAIWQKAGAKVDRTARHVWIDRGLLLEAIAQAPADFTWRARNPNRNVLIGGSALAFGPNGGMVYAMDLANGRRHGTLADFTNFVKLSHLINTIHFSSWEQVAIHDVPVSARHLQRLLIAFTHSDKAVMEAAHGRIITADNLAMARLVFGSLEGDPVIGDVINVNSPLRYDERMLGGLISYARAGQVCFITPFILAGAMSPVTMAAALAQQNAEALAGVALTQLVRPGAPVVYGGFTTNVDMKSGSPAFGTPEGAWAIIAGAQLARHYRLPYRASGGLTSAKTADAQAANESMWNLWPAVMAHSNLLMHAAGWLDGGLTASFEKFIIDAENLAMFSRFLEGFAIDDESLALDAIAEVGPGGHHFGTEHTQARYKTAFYQSALSDRLNFDAWQAAGGEDAAQRANAIWQELLAQYEAPPLDTAVAESLREYVARRERELAGINLYE